MKQWLFLILSFIASVSVAVAENSSTQSAKSYYPLQVGATWHYDLKVQGKQLKATNRVAKLEKIDGEELYRVETAISGQTSATEHLSVTDQGVFRHRFNGIEMTPPLHLLKDPAVLGASWTTTVEMASQTLEIRCNVADKLENVSVPAGDFDAIKLTVDTETEGTQILSNYWFAPDNGIIKQYLVVPDKSLFVTIMVNCASFRLSVMGSVDEA